MIFKFTICGKVFHANMINNELTREIAKHLPLDSNYTRFSEHEYYTRLPFESTDKNCKKEFETSPNEVWYFGGWNAFTILFTGGSTYPYEVVKLGEFVEDVASVLKNEKSHLRILCELEEK
ncbi:MAG: hypothetical protein IJ538_04065 [Clostridia bacterium]|nr:hypothetical protein [Clostridia bacterium]